MLQCSITEYYVSIEHIVHYSYSGNIIHHIDVQMICLFPLL